MLAHTGANGHYPVKRLFCRGIWRNDEIIPAVNSFNSQHDQFQIRIVNYDSLDLMHTELMAGKYCDFYLLDMDYSAMAGKKLFVDLMPMVEDTLKSTKV